MTDKCTWYGFEFDGDTPNSFVSISMVQAKAYICLFTGMSDKGKHAQFGGQGRWRSTKLTHQRIYASVSKASVRPFASAGQARTVAECDGDRFQVWPFSSVGRA
jgi:hypothetical protein